MPDTTFSLGRTRKITLWVRRVVVIDFIRSKPLGMDLADYLCELLEIVWAERRAKKIGCDPAPESDSARKTKGSDRTRCSVAVTAKILHLLQQNRPVGQIAERFRVSRGTVLKIKSRYAKAEHVRVSSGYNGERKPMSFCLQLPGQQKYGRS